MTIGRKTRQKSVGVLEEGENGEDLLAENAFAAMEAATHREKWDAPQWSRSPSHLTSAQAETDLAEGAKWYNRFRPGLGDDLVLCVEHAPRPDS